MSAAPAIRMRTERDPKKRKKYTSIFDRFRVLITKNRVGARIISYIAAFAAVILCLTGTPKTRYARFGESLTA